MTEPKDTARALVQTAHNVLGYTGPRFTDLHDARVLLRLALEELAKPWPATEISGGPIIHFAQETPLQNTHSKAAEIRTMQREMDKLYKALRNIAKPRDGLCTENAFARRQIAELAIAAYEKSAVYKAQKTSS